MKYKLKKEFLDHYSTSELVMISMKSVQECELFFEICKDAGIYLDSEYFLEDKFKWQYSKENTCYFLRGITLTHGFTDNLVDTASYLDCDLIYKNVKDILEFNSFKEMEIQW